MATRQDVARLAGTSPSVVSYVLNNGPRSVAPATRERVLAAVKELQYRPNAVARSLRMSHTMTLGLVVPDAANPFFAELARALEDHAWAAGYTLLVGNTVDDPGREAGYIRTFVDRQVDGLVLIPSQGDRPWRAELARSGVPSIVFDRELTGVAASHVVVDNTLGARLATEHLLAHGRRRVGCIAGPLGIHPTVDRVVGWRTALEGAGLKAGTGSGGSTGWEACPDAAPLLHGQFGRLDGYRSGRALLSRDRSVDALFVTSDEQAFGVLRAATELGIRVPEDLALVSFDGIAAGAYTCPALSTMRQPFEELARTAVQRLLGRMKEPDLPPTRDVLPVTLLARGSCGCPDPAGGEVLEEPEETDDMNDSDHTRGVRHG
ncbi:LacI family DNA-binding transcriptional regulator [Streptomyces antarcticus]|uniref:LacI family DNA-binding transcriptional regulator n=1 Tax=Streptomyces antarcticus TaxID=2996458 RepID=UPI0022715869|nr:MULTISPECIES: LacI family DNA-binding transcriptional regulator [unclassified Streptomyces]MCY0939807.1 LacI family DNA-binding transcriptional regulator [Streptomyces sp. H34-AA3]MCZ4080977.1 LacI family DNA-binding transcriptional regulator [Streptomyces sp. H34-S5]